MDKASNALDILTVSIGSRTSTDMCQAVRNTFPALNKHQVWTFSITSFQEVVDNGLLCSNPYMYKYWPQSNETPPTSVRLHPHRNTSVDTSVLVSLCL